ncbi:lymphocyte antigen 6 complex locus protein G6d isoform X2 [Macaca mulatta]|uniref:lymphocyte antigen 6 complex locus protein G6d isoform X4 n=1 Tax=Macaca mulatta TaxID=9544 RepID=UPI0000D9AC0F|nr:lymphocyte antigen 6 complex locus protein G6d isoform X4 [Macaca mulatta]
MKPQFVGILLSSLLGAALGNRMRCYNCGGSPSSSCKEAVTTCGEGRPQPGLEQIKLPGNPPVTLIHQHPACVAARHCNQVETESVGDVTYPAHRDCYLGDLCNSAVASHVAPTCILAAAATALTCLLPGLWSG